MIAKLQSSLGHAVKIMSIMWPKQCKCLMEIIEHSKTEDRRLGTED